MAGRGPAPSDDRVRRNLPTRGEWQDLPPVNPAKVPAMPKAPPGGWAAGTKLAWKAWHTDPASLVWSPADREALRLLTYLHHEVEQFDGTRGLASLLAELRQRSDALGLTQKGKRDLRLRIRADELGQKRAEAKNASPYAHLRGPRAVAGT